MADQMNLDNLFDDYGREYEDDEIAGFDEYDEVDEATRQLVDVGFYWKKCIDLINCWSKYQQVKWLYFNFTHEETRFKVKDVVDRYYDGRPSKVKDRENELSYLVDKELLDFAAICEFYGVESVTRDWLHRVLKESKNYDSYRKKCQRRQEKLKPAVSLRSL